MDPVKSFVSEVRVVNQPPAGDPLPYSRIHLTFRGLDAAKSLEEPIKQLPIPHVKPERTRAFGEKTLLEIGDSEFHLTVSRRLRAGGDSTIVSITKSGRNGENVPFASEDISPLIGALRQLAPPEVVIGAGTEVMVKDRLQTGRFQQIIAQKNSSETVAGTSSFRVS